MRKPLIVLAIVLAVAAFGAHMVTRKEHYPNRAAMTKAQIGSLGASIELYRQDSGRLPKQLNELIIEHPPGPYAIPRDLVDPWGRPFYYHPNQNGSSFVIFSLGSDGHIGGDGQAADQEFTKPLVGA